MIDTTIKPSSVFKRYMARRRREKQVIDSLAVAKVASDVAAAWGLRITDARFYRRDLAEVIAAAAPGLTERERLMLEWAVSDNVNAYCAYVPPGKRTLDTALIWPKRRPSFLDPMHYKLGLRASARLTG
jgi:hypothetical protein